MRDVIRRLLHEDSAHDYERAVSQESPSGSRVTPDQIRPGSIIGIRGPRHHGYHAIVSVDHGLVTMKCPDAREVTLPLSDLDDHEIVHTTMYT